MATQPRRRPRAQRIVRGSSRLAAYAELLALHEDARQTGSPLLTALGEAHLRRLLQRDRVPPASRRKAPAGRRSVLPHWDGDSRALWLGRERLTRVLRPGAGQADGLVAVV